MARACYDPEKAIEVWERFERVMPSQAEFLSTHPSPKHRKKNMEVFSHFIFIDFQQSPFDQNNNLISMLFS
jgi:DNA-binding SARP family transcriptional activator